MCSENAILELPLPLKTFSFSKVDLVSLKIKLTFFTKYKIINCPEGTRPKTLSLIVTPYKQKCGKKDRRYRRCGASHHCIRLDCHHSSTPVSLDGKLSYSFRSELFCDGNVNCAVGTQLPAGLSHQLSL